MLCRTDIMRVCVKMCKNVTDPIHSHRLSVFLATQLIRAIRRNPFRRFRGRDLTIFSTFPAPRRPKPPFSAFGKFSRPGSKAGVKGFSGARGISCLNRWSDRAGWPQSWDGGEDDEHEGMGGLSVGPAAGACQRADGGGRRGPGGRASRNGRAPAVAPDPAGIRAKLRLASPAGSRPRRPAGRAAAHGAGQRTGGLGLCAGRGRV